MKVLILTSNKDIIRQFCSGEIKDTHIIALDGDDDHQCKRQKTSSKCADMICAICGDHATGFNYNVLSCASCRIFFSRNAKQNIERIRCLTGERQCLVEYDLRRKCPRCRLQKCFSLGMRKDYQDNRNNVILNEKHNRLSEIISNEDFILIDHMRSLFISTFQDHDIQCSTIDVSDKISALISWSQFISRTSLDHITFSRRINEFEQLDGNDRFILMKYNLFPVIFISKCYYYKPCNDCCSNDNSELANKHRRFYMLCGDIDGIRDAFIDIIILLVQVTEQDPSLLSLLLTIIILSPGLSVSQNEPLLKDELAVNQAQSQYITLLWKYLLSKKGHMQAIKQFIQITSCIIRIQSVAKRIREFVHFQSIASNILDKMAPLMTAFLFTS